MVQKNSNKPSKPGHVWVEDKSVEAGGYFRKLPPSAKVAPSGKDGEGPKGDIKDTLAKVALGAGGALVGGYIVGKTGEAINDALMKKSIKDAYEAGEFNDGEFNDLKRFMAEFYPGYEKEMDKWQRRDSDRYDMAPRGKGLAATTAGLLAVSAEHGPNPKSEKGTASGVGDVTGLGYRDSPGIRAEKKKKNDDSSDRYDKALRTGVPTKPGHTWVEDRTVKGGGYFRKLATGETAKGSKPPQSAGGGVAAKIGLGSLAALAATGLAAAATSKQQKQEGQDKIARTATGVLVGTALAGTGVAAGVTNKAIQGVRASYESAKAIEQAKKKKNQQENIEKNQQEKIASQEASVGAVPTKEQELQARIARYQEEAGKYEKEKAEKKEAKKKARGNDEIQNLVAQMQEDLKTLPQKPVAKEPAPLKTGAELREAARKRRTMGEFQAQLNTLLSDKEPANVSDEAKKARAEIKKAGDQLESAIEGARQAGIKKERETLWKDTPGPSKDKPTPVIPPTTQRALLPARDRGQPEPINTSSPKGAKLMEEMEKYNAARKAQGNDPITLIGRDNPVTTSVSRRPAPVMGATDKPLNGEKLAAKKDRQAATKLKTLEAELEQYNQARKAQGAAPITLTGREGAGFGPNESRSPIKTINVEARGGSTPSPQQGKVKQNAFEALASNPARQERMKKLKDELASPPSEEALAAERKYNKEIAAQPDRSGQVIGKLSKKQRKGSMFGGITTRQRSARVSQLKDMFL
jgi:hypothetical protein